jgi:hypothetical protein
MLEDGVAKHYRGAAAKVLQHTQLLLGTFPTQMGGK